MRHIQLTLYLMLLSTVIFGQDTAWLRGKSFAPIDANSFKTRELSPNYDSIATINGLAYNRYFEVYFEQHSKGIFDTAAMYGFLWAKFRIDERGNLGNIESDTSAPLLMKNFILEMLQATNGLWNLNRQKSQYRQGMTIILPIRYYIAYDEQKEMMQSPPIPSGLINYFFSKGNQQTLLFLPLVDIIHVIYR